MIRECAPGKIILFGEHAVVYGRPALAIPVQQLQACAEVSSCPSIPSNAIRLQSAARKLDSLLDELPAGDPLAEVCRLTLRQLGAVTFPGMLVRIESSIPTASGMGSGAAVSVAVVRAMARFLNSPLSNESVNAIAYEVEEIHHGTPSGIDNTVITYAQPVFFIGGQGITSFEIGHPFTLLIADSGVQSSTADAVGRVRQSWKKEPALYEALFNRIGSITTAARSALAVGDLQQVGTLMNENQELLQEIGVSAPVNNLLAETARQAGAWGAKLSGGGLGGNVIAIAPDDHIQTVHAALLEAGAAACWQTEVS